LCVHEALKELWVKLVIMVPNPPIFVNASYIHNIPILPSLKKIILNLKYEVHIHVTLKHRNKKLLGTVCLMMVLLTYSMGQSHS